MNYNSYLREVFPEPPLIANRRQRNIRYILIRDKIPQPNFSKSKQHFNGMKRCMKQCPICPFKTESKQIQEKEFTW